MADVSHELGALRFVVDSPLSSKVAMFNKQTQQHKEQQLLNPFSGASGRASPKPSFSKDEYGKPLAGSLTEMRGQKANMHVLREMLELCQIIDSEGYNVKDEPTMRVIPFGELFNIYNYISDKVVGILLRARKHKLVDFEGEMLFQRRDDDVPVFLLKPIAEIRQELQAKIEDIKRGSSPAPQATSVLLDKKLSSRSSTPSASPAPSKATTPAQSKASSPAPEAATVEKVEKPPQTAVAAVVQQQTDTASPKATAEVTAAVIAPASVPILQVTEVKEVVEPNSEVTRLEGGQEPSKPAENTDGTAAMPTVTAQSEELVQAAEQVEAPLPNNTADIPNQNEIENSATPTIVVDATAVFTGTVPSAAAPAETLEEAAAATITDPPISNNNSTENTQS